MEVNFWVTISSSILSLLGCTFILTVYYMFPSLQIFAYLLVKDLTIFSLLHCLSDFLPSGIEATCQIQGFGLSSSAIQIMAWSCVISITLYMRIVKRKTINEERFRRNSLIVVITLSVLMTILPFTSSGFKETPYGKDGPWCWITDDYEYGTWWKFAQFYIPCVICVLFNVFVTVCVVRVIKREYKNLIDPQQFPRKLIFRLWMYPLVIVVCLSPCAIFRIEQAISKTENGHAESCLLYTSPSPRDS